MKGAFYARPVVTGELTDPRDDIVQVIEHDLLRTQDKLMIYKARCRHASKVHDDLQQVIALVGGAQCLLNRRRQNEQQRLQVIGNSLLLCHVCRDK